MPTLSPETDPLTLDAYWLVLWEPQFKTLKGVGQVGCVFATEKEARQMLAAWPGGEVFEVVRAERKRDPNCYAPVREEMDE